jgi:branched-chain amino acid transport system substrate-binding protein
MRRFVVIAALMLGISACGGSSTSNSGSSGAGGPALKIGHWAPLSGSASANGKFEANGVALAVAEVNAAGGVLKGRKVEVVEYDDQGVPDQSVSVVRRLLDQDQVTEIVGGILSGNTIATGAITKGRAVSMVTAAKAAITATTNDPLFFALDSSLATDTAFMQSYLAAHPEKFACTNIFMIAEDSPYGKGDSGLYQGLWQKAGTPKIAALKTYTFQSTDFGTILTQVKNSKADCLYVNGNIGEMTALLQQINSAGIKLPIFAATSNISQPMVKDAGPSMEGIISGDVYDPTIKNAENAKFVADYKAKYGANPERQAALGYTAMKIVLAAVDKAGSTDPAKVADQIRGTTFKTPFGPITFDQGGHSNMKPIVTTVKNGQVSVVQ